MGTKTCKKCGFEEEIIVDGLCESCADEIEEEQCMTKHPKERLDLARKLF